jgi:hypothetical protein
MIFKLSVYRIKMSLVSQLTKLEEQKLATEQQCVQLQEQLAHMKQQLISVKSELRLERVKNSVLSYLLSSQTKIKVEEVFLEQKDGLHIYNVENGGVPIFIHEHLLNQQGSAVKKIKNTPIVKNKSVNYKTVKNRVELSEEKPTEQEEKIKKVEEEYDTIVQENFDVSIKNTNQVMEDLFTEIKSNRIYKRYLIELKENRGKLLGRLNLEEYIKIINTHIDRLNAIFTDKHYDTKKREATIMIALSPLDQRLVFYKNYYNSVLEPDEIQRLKTTLKVNISYTFPKRYVPFIHTELHEKIYNYGLSIFSIKDTLKRSLINPFGFSNIVYLNLNANKSADSSESDQYSFYALEKIESDGRRCWKLELRLDDLSRNLSQHMKTYCVNLFRKIYMDIFNDNIYREDYQNIAPIAQQDCQQLLVNILLLSKPKEFCNMLRAIVSKYSTIKPTELDKFNLTGDDKLHKRQFAKDVDDNQELTTTVKRLFDDISTEDAEKIWREYTA